MQPKCRHCVYHGWSPAPWYTCKHPAVLKTFHRPMIAEIMRKDGLYPELKMAWDCGPNARLFLRQPPLWLRLLHPFR